jgi:coenzyme F420-reducing hydrogenase, beta subunit (EC 1.12.98.1)
MVLGNYKQAVAARSTDPDILRKSQDGGIVTQLFAYALDAGIIDGAIVAGQSDEPFKPNRWLQPPVRSSSQHVAPATPSLRTCHSSKR